MSKMVDQPPKKVFIKIPLLNQEQALLISEVLSIDKELKGSGVKRETRVEADCLVVTFDGVDYKKLRVSINALLKNILLIIKTYNLLS
ncbi:uncharacterized protein LOC123653532 isoform X2 [Melitaea cinxia]|uniref:uncharacterized protein LOC123653532 isoform X2 n=1 Tax=Melitaea cinxia TaxID=113334 RepID=UPI001E2748BE|nr:uncharacterized protein LOC123653532 isoform X2 [Melitaea cinxia]